jgi:predicted N-acetyltransferase YhbS
MELVFREAKEKDFKQSVKLTRDAFRDDYKPRCDEHFVLYKIRNSEGYIKDLDIVAVAGENLNGHIISES